MQTISESIEPYANRWSKKWIYPIDKDTVKTHIYSLIRLIEKNSLSDNGSGELLVRSLLWYYLYQLEVDSACLKVDSLTSKVSYVHKTDKPVADWIKGVNLIRSNRIREGISVLDSLRTFKLFHNENFLIDYAHLSAECFLPFLTSEIKIGTPAIAFAENDSEYNSVKTGWSILNSLNGHIYRVPVFQFTSSYILSGQIPLLLSLQKSDPVRLKLTVADQIIRNVHYPLLYEYSIQKQDAMLKIILTESDDKISMDEQLRTLVENRYDIIKGGIQTGQLRGISLKCYKRSFYPDVPGEFCGYVIFDKVLHSRRPQFYSTSRSNNGWMKVRYLISISSTTDVEYKAVPVLESIVSRFTALQ